MAKPEIKSNPRVNQLFDELEKYLDFCKTYGYRYDPADLFSNRSYVYRQYVKYLSGKPVKDMWEVDSKSVQ